MNVPQLADIQNAAMLRLPNELLCQIAGYFAADKDILEKDDGYITITVGKMRDTITLKRLQRRSEYNVGVQSLVHLALACKRLAPVGQELLYRSVSLMQPRTFEGQCKSAFVSFLRTVIARPDLATLVEHLAV